MISTIRGRLLKKQAGAVVVETAGVGFEIQVPLRILGDLPEEGKEVFLYTHIFMKDNEIALYGFLNEADRTVFRSLISISGIGPKLALNILAGTTAEEFYRAVQAEDTALLSRFPGIGKKTAKRIIFELKQTIGAIQTPHDRLYEDVLSALMNLGYKRKDSEAALDKVYNKEHDIETIIKEALKYLNSQR